MQWDPGTVCSKLREFISEDRRIFKLAAGNEVDSFYIDALNLPKNEYKCGSLLKDWSLIPGRDKSPTRDLKKKPNSCSDLLEAANSQQSNTFQQYSDEHSKDLPRPLSPDLFSSDDDACLGTSQKANEYKSFSETLQDEKHFSPRLSLQNTKTTVEINNAVSHNSTSSIEVIELSDDDSDNNEYVGQITSFEFARSNLKSQKVKEADIAISGDGSLTEVSPKQYENIILCEENCESVLYPLSSEVEDSDRNNAQGFGDNINFSDDDLSDNFLSNEDSCSRQSTSLMVDMTDIIQPMSSESSDDSAIDKEIENIFEGKNLSASYARDDEYFSNSNTEEESSKKSCFENAGCFQITDENTDSEQSPVYEKIDTTSVGLDLNKASFCRSSLGHNSLDLNVTEYVKTLLSKENYSFNYQGRENNYSANNFSRLSSPIGTSGPAEFKEDQPGNGIFQFKIFKT